MLKPLKNRRNFVLIGTALLVVFLLSYYFFTYVPAREQQMNQRGIRAISRLDENLHERIDHYKNSVSQFECDYYLSNKDAVEEIIGHRVYFRLFSCAIAASKEGENPRVEALRGELRKRLQAFSEANPYVPNPTDAQKEKRSREFNATLNKFVEDSINAITQFKDTLNPKTPVDKLIEAFREIDQTKAIFIDSITSRWSGRAYAYLGITYENALKRIDNGALFKEVILSEPDSNRVVNQNDLNLKYFRYMPSKENEPDWLETLALDGEGNKSSSTTEEHLAIHIENVDITDKTISGIDYICFTRFLEIEGKPFYLTGLVEHDVYDANVRKISVWVVMIFILLTLFFILVLPIAKPFLLSKKERLKSIDIMWSAIALVFGIAILSMLIIGVDTFIIEEKNLVTKKLRMHAEALQKDFQTELEQTIATSMVSSGFDLGQKDDSPSTTKVDYARASSVFTREMGSLSDNIREAEWLRKEPLNSQFTDSLKVVNAYLEEKIAQESEFINALNFSLESKLEFIRISPSGKAKLYALVLEEGKVVKDLTNAFNALKASVLDPKQTDLREQYIDYQEALNCTDLSISQINSSLNLSHRAYYQTMKDKNPSNAWGYSMSDSTKIPYYIESLFSLSSGKYSTVTVTKGNSSVNESSNYSYGTDHEWESVNNRYLEPGYTFAVIDNGGTIHFHSDQQKIKNQNFLEETDFSNALSSFLHNRSKQSLGLRFSMKDHQAFVSPIANTPWYVVIMYDIRKSRLNVTQSIITTFQVLIMILMYMLLLHVVLNIDQSASHHGRKNSFSYLFLSPINVSTRVLKVLAGFNLGQIVALMIVYAFNSINLLANITIFFSMITAGLLINYVVLTKYSLVLHNSEEMDSHKKISGFEWVLLVFWFLWFVLTYVVSGGGGYALFIHLLEIGIIYYYFNLKRNSPNMEFFLSESIKRPFLSKTMGGYLPFYVHSFSWIVLVGVVSTFLFFKPIYNMQHIKRGLNNWVEEFEAKNAAGYVSQPDHKVNLFAPVDDTYFEEIDRGMLQRSSVFLDYISMYFDEDEASFIGQGTSIDDILVYRRYDSKRGTPYFEVKPSRDTYRQSLVMPEANTMIAFDLPSIDHSEDTGLAILFWLAIILFLWIVFYTVEALGKKFFYLDLLKRLKAVSEEVDNKQASLTQLSISGFSGNNANLMLVGPPYSGRNTIAKSLIHKSQECKYLDFFNKLNEEAKKIDEDFIRNPIIINNFDYRNLDYKLNDTKLDLLEKIIRMRNEHQVSAPLILVSSFSTNQIIAFYKNRVKELMKKSPDNKEEIDSLTSSVYRWESILFGFTTYIVKLSHHPSSDFIENELSFGSTLIYLMPQIKEFEEKLMQQKGGLSDEELEEKIVEAITDMAQNYYSAIWNACSQEEKFLLYDMSQDGLVNPKNERMLSILVRKGLLLTSPALRIFNRSFALFVVENISEEDGAQMEREAKKEGIWMTYRYLVIFLVVVMIVFLAFVEKEVINKMTGIITAGGILLPRIVSFFSSLGNLKLFGKKA